MSSVQNSYNPYNLNSYRVILDADSIKSVKNPEYALDKEEKKNNKKAVVSICTITAGLSLLVTSLVLLRRGKGAGIQKLKNFIDNNVSKLKKNENLTKFQKKVIEKSDVVKNNLDRLNAVNNFASVKDVPICKGMRKIGMGGICDAISNFFSKITHNTIKSSYNRTEKAFSGVFDRLAKLDTKTLASKSPNEILEIGGVKKTVAEWLKISSEHQKLLRESLQNGFGEAAHTERYSKLRKAFSTIQDEFWNKLFVSKNPVKKSGGRLEHIRAKSKEIFETGKNSTKELSETFVLEDIAASRKMNYVNEVYKHKSAITNTLSDRCDQAVDVMQNIRFETPDAKPYKDMLKKVLEKVKQLSKKGQNSEAVMADINAQTSELLEALSKSSDVANKDAIMKVIKNNIENLSNEASKGKLQQLLEIQKGLLPEKEYAELEKSVNSAISKLNKSARKEGGDFVDKIRDIESGSSVTDVFITGGIPIIGSAAAMATADSNKERRAVLLKRGIPLTLGVLVSLACTAGIVPITISLIIGAASSFALGKIGKIVNDKIEEKEKIDELNNKTAELAEKQQTSNQQALTQKV